MEYDFHVRQMNLCQFMQADNLPLSTIWRNLWCWNPESAIKSFIFYAKGGEKLGVFSFLIGLFNDISGMECICLLHLFWWPQDAESIDRVFYFCILALQVCCFKVTFCLGSLHARIFASSTVDLEYRIQDYHRRWVGFILSWISVRTDVAVLNELRM